MSTLASINGKGTVGSRPGFGIAGQTYFATDVLGGTLQRDTGSAWENLTNGTMVQLQRTVTAGAQTTVSLPSIPATYSGLHLQIYGRSAGSGTPVSVTLQFNADTGANYDMHEIYAHGTSSTVDSGIGTTSTQTCNLPGAGALTSRAGLIQIDIPDYANTTFHKALLSRSSAISDTVAANNYVTTAGGLWRSTAAIASIVVAFSDASAFVNNSSVTLYGIV